MQCVDGKKRKYGPNAWKYVDNTPTFSTIRI
jgi:hypothetical protein